MADAVRQNNEVPGWVQKLPAIEELTGELIAEKLFAGPSRAVQDEDRILHFASGAADWLAQSPVVNLNFARCLAAAKMEIAKYVITFDGLGNAGRTGDRSQQTGTPE
jgi:hypothetical protein